MPTFVSAGVLANRQRWIKGAIIGILLKHYLRAAGIKPSLGRCWFSWAVVMVATIMMTPDISQAAVAEKPPFGAGG